METEVKTNTLTLKQKLKIKADALKKKKELEAEKKRQAEIARKEKENIEKKAIEGKLKELESKENVILGKWLREAYESNFNYEVMKELKEKTKLLIEEGKK